MISNRCYYGLKAVLELAKRDGTGKVTICQIANAQAIPQRFLEAILRQLKEAGYARAQRGKEGGYFLSKPADEITAGEIIRLFEGPLVTLGKRSGHTDYPDDVFHHLWTAAESALIEVYDSVNFHDLARDEKTRLSQAAPEYMI